MFDCFASIVSYVLRSTILYILCGLPCGALRGRATFCLPAGSGTPGIAAFRINLASYSQNQV
jgi:hypothetical protein